MIVVRVELWSARTGQVTEIARMRIANDGAATAHNPRRGDYQVETFAGRHGAMLDKGRVSRRGRVTDWPRLDVHVWNLVRAALQACGYDKGQAKEGAPLSPSEGGRLPLTSPLR